MSLRKLQTCLGAALCAAIGGTLAKYAFSDDVEMIYKAVLIPLAIGSNALGLSIFVDFMHQVGSVQATFLVKAVECVLTALVGYVLFHEHLSWYWLFGTMLILGGIYVLNQADSNYINTDPHSKTD